MTFARSSPRWHRLLLAAAVPAVAGSLVACSGSKTIDLSDGQVLAGAARPAAAQAELPAAETGHPAPVAAAGRVTVVNFFGSWCAECKAEAGDLERASATAGVPFVGVAELDVASRVRAYAARFGITYPLLLDDEGRYAATFRRTPIPAPPTTVIIDAHGRVAARWLGSLGEPELLREIRLVQQQS